MRGCLSLEITFVQIASPSGLTHSVTDTFSLSFIYGQFSISTLCYFIYLFDRDNANKHSVKTKHVTEVWHIKFIAIANF